jgi:hypothetical protein
MLKMNFRACKAGASTAEFRTQPILPRFSDGVFRREGSSRRSMRGSRWISDSRRQFIGALLVHFNRQAI